MQLPLALLDSLKGLPGFEPDSFVAVHQRAEQIPSIRLNPAKTNDATTTLPLGEPIPWCSGGWYLRERPSFTLDPFFHAGHYYVQEASSMFLHHALTQVLGDRRGLRGIDLCAAPGGKSTLMASLPHFALVVCNELIRTRVPVLTENLSKWGTAHSWATQNDPRDIGRLEGYFDVMVVDAPCSGSGLFRRDPELIVEWSERNVKLCSERQQRILADALPALSVDGILIYSTCSYSAEEDERILDWLLAHDDVESIEIALNDDWGVVPVRSSRGASGYRFYPHRLKGEGLFMACLRKKSGIDGLHHKQGALALAGSREKALAAPWLKDGGEGLALVRKESDLFAIPAALTADLSLLQQHLQVRKTGIRIGALAHEAFLPDHELALSVCLASGLPTMELDRERALTYLRKEPLVPPVSDKGWHLVRHDGAALGWAKLLGNRINNYYPSAWRILHL
jgi:16S rRNA C967 or C1407 C5-methylase (RsmB/RsmF family)/NOL1/NOP2/fmu family ribosome biogenesis protein